MATIAVFLVLGGGAYAAFHLPRNSVRSRNIVNGQVKNPDLAKSRLHNFPGLAFSRGDCTANVLMNPQPPPIVDQWAVLASPYTTYAQTGYARDAQGWVHLQGVVQRCGNPPSNSVIFTLPKRYRPLIDETFAGVRLVPHPVTPVGIKVRAGGDVKIDGPTSPGDQYPLSGISFRCGPKGKHGCP